MTGTSVLGSLRKRLVDSPTSLGGRARARRWELFERRFPDIADLDVVDLGGTVEFWQRVPTRPRHVVVVNLSSEKQGPPPEWMTVVYGDACDPPTEVREANIDLVYSNSVIEHVGGHARRQQFAHVVTDLAKRHWIQTPYRYFPIEPHWLFPGFQFLPAAARQEVAYRWPLVHTRPRDRDDALATALDVELLSKTELQMYFRSSEIIEEKFGPLTKSLIAVE
jgi:hypothetical protein